MKTTETPAAATTTTTATCVPYVLAWWWAARAPWTTAEIASRACLDRFEHDV